MSRIIKTSRSPKNTSKAEQTSHGSINKPGFNMIDSATNLGRGANKFSGKGEDVPISETKPKSDSSVTFAPQSSDIKSR